MSTDLIMPDLGLPPGSLYVSLWLVDVGTAVRCGDRLLEVAAEGVTVDLPSPADGVLRKTLVAEDDPLSPGQRLAVIDDVRTT